MAHRKKISNIYEIPEVIKFRGMFLAIGIFIVVLGLLAIVFASEAIEFTIDDLGYILACAGALQIICSAFVKKWSGFSLCMLTGLLYLAIGALCIFPPINNPYSIPYLIIVLFLVIGLFRLLTALEYHFNKWKIVFVNGLIAILLGLLVLAEWPSAAIWAIGIYIGIDLLIIGKYWIWLSIAKKAKIGKGA